MLHGEVGGSVGAGIGIFFLIGPWLLMVDERDTLLLVVLVEEIVAGFDLLSYVFQVSALLE